MGCALGDTGTHHADACQKVWPWRSGPRVPRQTFLSSGDVTKCAETLQKLISTRREHGTRQQVGTFDATSEDRIDAVLHAGSERTLVLAS